MRKYGHRLAVASLSLIWLAAVCEVHASLPPHHSNTVQDFASEASTAGIPSLYVWEYDNQFDWEHVRTDNGMVTQVIEWLCSLRDRLTVSLDKPLGEPLLIPWQWWLPPAASELRSATNVFEDVSLLTVIRAQLSEDAMVVMLPKSLLLLFQLTLLPDGPDIAELSVTTAPAFWHAVEATSEAGRLVQKRHMAAERQILLPIEDYVVMLPTMNAVHGQDNWQGEHVSDMYADHTVWDQHTITDMLQQFFDSSGAVSLPELAEYRWKLDKVAMLKVYQDYNQQKPFNSTPPIPSQLVHVPVSAETLAELCYSARYADSQPEVAPNDIRAAVLTLLHAAHLLESDQNAQQIQESNQVVGSSPVRKYFLKRNLAGGSSCVTSFTLTNKCSWQQDQAHNGSVGASHTPPKKVQPFTTAGNSSQTKSSQQQDLGTHSACQHDMHAMLRDAQQLLKAAEQVVRQSCQEDWLLQPYIPNIEEYRVYLIGGADAKAPHQIVPVFTPAAFHNGQLFAWNATLPPGYFSTAPADHKQHNEQPRRLQQLCTNGTQPDVYSEAHFPYPIWRDEEMHALLVKTALNAADAIATSGQPIRTGQHVMLRVDMILTSHAQQVKPFVNEAHVFNDGRIAFSTWPPELGQADFGARLYNASGASGDYVPEGEELFIGDYSHLTIGDQCSAAPFSADADATWLPSKGLLLMHKLWKDIRHRVVVNNDAG